MSICMSCKNGLDDCYPINNGKDCPINNYQPIIKQTEFERVPDMQGYYISSNAPHSGVFVPMGSYQSLTTQLEASEKREKELVEMLTMLFQESYPEILGTPREAQIEKLLALTGSKPIQGEKNNGT